MKTVESSQFGKDHWGLLAYFETRCVDYRGIIDPRHLRCNRKNHPHMDRAGLGPNGLAWKPEYGTIIKGGKKLESHDDWNCLDDLEAANLVEMIGTGINPAVKITELGMYWVGLLRKHKMSGGMYGNFEGVSK